MAVIAGDWYEESDYSTYPKEKWCDYDYMAAWIRERGYTPETDMEHLINMIFAHYECECEETKEEYSIEGCQRYAEACGLAEFDYYG